MNVTKKEINENVVTKIRSIHSIGNCVAIQRSMGRCAAVKSQMGSCAAIKSELVRHAIIKRSMGGYATNKEVNLYRYVNINQSIIHTITSVGGDNLQQYHSELTAYSGDIMQVLIPTCKGKVL